MAQKKILVIGSPSTETGEGEALRAMANYVTAAVDNSDEQVEVQYCQIDKLGYVAEAAGTMIYDLQNNCQLTEYNLVFFRGKFKSMINDAALVAIFLQQHAIPTVNSAFAQRRAIGKIPQMFRLQAMGLPIPYTVTAASADLPDLIAQHLTYPIVVKDVYGAHGNDNYLVKSAEELHDILSRNPDIRFMAQAFIPNDCDYRVLLIGPHELIIKRQAAGESHLNNTSQGGNATLVPVAEFPAEIIAESRAFAADCQYELAGVDVIFNKDTGEHYYLEINSQPQIASGAFVSEKASLLGAYFRTLIGLA